MEEPIAPLPVRNLELRPIEHMPDSRQTVVFSCQGASPAARLAAEVAAELKRTGAVVNPDESSEIGRDQVVIALDGCNSACRARTLEARGVELALALNLSELSEATATQDDPSPRELAAGVLDRLRRRSARRTSHKARASSPPTTATMPRRAHTVDDYLLAIDRLGSATVECGAMGVEAPTIAAHVSRLLDISRASAGEMIVRLEEHGFVQQSRSKALLLTSEGRARADAVTRRHRVLECFVTEFLGYPIADAYERAFVIGPSFDESAIARVHAALHEPERCPHGWPLDPSRTREESRRLMALSALPDGEEAVIVRIAEDDRELIEQLDRAGLTPGRKVAVQEGGGGTLSVRIDGATRPVEVGVEPAGGVFVAVARSRANSSA